MSTCVVERLVRAEPGRVFREWTAAERLATWWWPMFDDTEYAMEPIAGGRWLAGSDEAGFAVRGMVTEVVPDERIAFTWRWEGAGASDVRDIEDHVIVTFERTSDGTLVRVAHTSNEPLDDGGIEQGWEGVLDRLVQVSE